MRPGEGPALTRGTPSRGPRPERGPHLLSCPSAPSDLAWGGGAHPSGRGPALTPHPQQVMLQLEKKLFDYSNQEVFRGSTTALRGESRRGVCGWAPAAVRQCWLLALPSSRLGPAWCASCLWLGCSYLPHCLDGGLIVPGTPR